MTLDAYWDDPLYDEREEQRAAAHDAMRDGDYYDPREDRPTADELGGDETPTRVTTDAARC